ncbi:hypothetical protein CAS74_000420 [Pichia kudriavzevii]|uniref:Altered inheritance of mitochondria protein 1 n=1 Tax=Pichia kudriavzevii TaxID=4909 RepID=A0A099P6C3_PICKU|nr:uncharacterized protein C5L36_0C04040 [Pichia kudriavzevii]AWU76468.1 hypothetical protein C5L36_0C04040 [Pichia kudriavzevii]KGK40440.1 hypothetical protein JL09_g305 [Pichia kudriavzevii]ONH75633.1 Altered inheritance of mitochondria protein 1 [Pichia kudriavzevii]OUT24037.1 hypothetical protein CAS74_000420 [Pichia kudriavzevii]
MFNQIYRSSIPLIRRYSTAHLDDAEKHIYNKLKATLSPTTLEVRDVSGGCGSMYAIQIVSEKFNGLPMIKQHRLVNEILKEEIAKWHGLQLKTKAANRV